MGQEAEALLIMLVIVGSAAVLAVLITAFAVYMAKKTTDDDI